MEQNTFFERFLALEPKLMLIAHAQLNRPCDAEDAVQDTFIKAWLHSDELRDERIFESWLCRICRNTCIDFIRKQRQRRENPLTEEICPVVHEDVLRRLWLESMLNNLTMRCRETMIAFYLEGLSVKETAIRYGRPEGTVKAQLYKARKTLAHAALEKN